MLVASSKLLVSGGYGSPDLFDVSADGMPRFLHASQTLVGLFVMVSADSVTSAVMWSA